MPTSRPRYQVTETPAVAHALDVAARRWPDESRSSLLLCLVHAGMEALEREQSQATRRREEAIEATSGKYADVFGDDHLATLRQGWPE
ncbi:hypothetical protein [Pseudonocardia acaciae]|uniref:hypothetical protein n=1 Tax=Pseudonocardia acaciae TaxID=551276 RepID=UPI00048C9D65|nr:hypothetical protein [Pseudonocardia acaciae]